jgi:uncharacterized protein YndB with AHSA1/START domain
MIMKRWISLLIIMAVMIFVSGCSVSDIVDGWKNTPYVSIQSTPDVTVGGKTVFEAHTAEGATVDWTVPAGTLDKASGLSVTWIAPSTPGTYTITANAKLPNGKTVTDTKNIIVNSAPVELVDSDIITNADGTQTMSTTFKNNSSKTIKEFNFRLVMWDSSDQYLSEGTSGIGKIFSISSESFALASGESYTHTWTTPGASSAAKLSAWVYSIGYNDASNWEM